MAAIPPLKLRKDIWTYFPVNMDAIGRGANGADRYGIEWHNMKIRAAATAARMTPDAYKQQLFPKMLQALQASNAWNVEAPPPGSRFIAVIAMRFGAPAAANNATRKVMASRRLSASPKPKSPIQTRKSKSPNKPKSKSPTQTRKSKSPNKPKSKSPTQTRKSPTQTRKSLTPTSLLKRAKAILNIMSDATADKLTAEFAALTPKTAADFAALMKLVLDVMLDTQAYHPLIIKLLHALDAKHHSRPYPQLPSAALADLLMARIATEPRFVLLEIQTEEGELEATNAVEEDIMRQKRFHRSAMLFVGYMYREGFIPYTSLAPVIQKLLKAAQDTDDDYRLQDASVQGLIFILIRAGQRMETDAPKELAELKQVIKALSESIRRGAIKALCLEFLEAAEGGYKIKEGVPWAVGAPKGDIKRAGPAQPQPAALGPLLAPPAPQAPQAPKEALGADIGELWRRFPLDVKQQGDVWIVRFHMKKLAERFARESGRYRTQREFEDAQARHILSLVDNSTHWKRGPPPPAGALVTITAK